MGYELLVRGLFPDTEGKHIVSGGYPVAWGAPTYKNLAEDWNIMKTILAPVTTRKDEQLKTIEVMTGGKLWMWSMDNPEPIRGGHYERFIMNEWAQVREAREIWNAIIRPTLIDLKGESWFLSTPKGMNHFHEIDVLGMDENDPEWKSWHFTSFDNPFLDPEELKALKRTMTEEEYRQEILAEYIEGAGSVFRNLDAALTAPVTSPEEHLYHTMVAGIDWGKQNDFTVTSVGCVDCEVEVDLDRFSEIDYHFQMTRVETILDRWNVEVVHPEFNSMGEMPVEALQRAGYRVVPFKTTLISKFPLIENFATALERGDIQLLPDRVARGELEAYERKTTETGLSKYSAPSGMHDDTVIARALMYKVMRGKPKRKEHTQRDEEAMEVFRNLGKR